jgi:hypothetical protein
MSRKNYITSVNIFTKIFSNVFLCSARSSKCNKPKSLVKNYKLSKGKHSNGNGIGMNSERLGSKSNLRTTEICQKSIIHLAVESVPLLPQAALMSSGDWNSGYHRF